MPTMATSVHQTPVPIVVKCRLCGESLTLKEDSQAARDLREDPRQQLIVHLRESHKITEIAAHARRVAWLVDMLAFSSDDTRYRDTMVATLDYFAGGGM